ASSKSIKQIEKELDVDSLGYLSIEGMLAMPSLPNNSFCASCFSGKYPFKISSAFDKMRLEKL
ncbi:MAG: amidophosphoribosyltransferase, partial [candidate division Zixibacteria bacterium]|nr:amidophosphoribosyltransferase [candidate division Zixibacteria bacterium]